MEEIIEQHLNENPDNPTIGTLNRINDEYNKLKENNKNLQEDRDGFVNLHQIGLKVIKEYNERINLLQKILKNILIIAGMILFFIILTIIALGEHL